MKWADPDDLDRVAQTRMRCYTTVDKELAVYQERIRTDGRARVGDFLLAEQDGQAVGTATSLSQTMWVRGSPLRCQGVAWVGTIKTKRRTGNASERGIASRIMHETLNKARERGQVVSALMPFRASFYEHFGYGLVERQNEWTIPLSLLPNGNCDGIDFMKPTDLPLVQACYQRMVQVGQCDIERSDASWKNWSSQWPDGFCVVDRSPDSETVHSWLYLNEIPQPGAMRLLRVMDAAWDSPQAFGRILHFLSGLRDQYSTLVWILPADLALNRLLKEPQLPHRPVAHATAKVAPQTRMQIRVLDHVRFLHALKLQDVRAGEVVVQIIEPEGERPTFELQFEQGHVQAKPTSATPQVVCDASLWAAIASGDLSASQATQLPAMHQTDRKSITLLDAFSAGPAPFCNEYF